MIHRRPKDRMASRRRRALRRTARLITWRERSADTAGVTYQWYSGTSGNTGNPIAGATGSSFTMSPSSTSTFWVRATGSCGRTTDSATATVTVWAKAPARHHGTAAFGPSDVSRLLVGDRRHGVRNRSDVPVVRGRFRKHQ